MIEGPGDMEVTGYGNRRTREPVVIFDFMNKFDGTLVNNVFVGPTTSHEKYSVTYTVEKTADRALRERQRRRCRCDARLGQLCRRVGTWSCTRPRSPVGDPGTQRWKIVVSGSQARTRDQMGNLVRGPLSEGGRVWNPDCVHPTGTIVMRFRDLRLSPDGNRFAGKWGGPPPQPTPQEPNPPDTTLHGNAIVGTRVGTKPGTHDTADAAARSRSHRGTQERDGTADLRGRRRRDGRGESGRLRGHGLRSAQAHFVRLASGPAVHHDRTDEAGLGRRPPARGCRPLAGLPLPGPARSPVRAGWSSRNAAVGTTNGSNTRSK